MGPADHIPEKSLLIETVEKAFQHIHAPVWPFPSAGEVELKTLTKASPGEADERIRSAGLTT